MNKKISQKGSALVVITVIITVIILGALGFLLWNNLNTQTSDPSHENHSSSDADTTEETTPLSSAGFNAAFGLDLSFTYPADWTLAREVDGPIPFASTERYTAETLTVTSPSKDTSVKFRLMAYGGLGGTCMPDTENTIASITTTPVPKFQPGMLTEFTTHNTNGYRYYASIMRSEKARAAKVGDSSCALYMADIIFLEEERDIKLMDAKIQSKVFNDENNTYARTFSDLSEVATLQATSEYQQAKAILTSFALHQ